MRYLVDTNILLRSIQPAHPMHGASVRAVTILLAAGQEVCVFNQSLIEFWNAATRDPDKNGLGLTPAQTDTEVRRIESLLIILSDHPAVYPVWRQLVVTHAVAGKQVHDTRLAAAVKVYGLTHLLTYNGGDFKRFRHITIVDPDSIVSQPPQPAPITGPG